jgi:plastocyanin
MDALALYVNRRDLCDRAALGILRAAPKTMNRQWPWGPLVLILLVILWAVATPSAEEKTDGTLYVVEMYDFYYDPPGLFLQPGDRVAWVMVEDHLADGHSATAYHPEFDKELRIPETAQAWSSELLKTIDASYEHMFESIGIHDYFCIPHEDVGMVGRLIVREATGPGAKPLSQGISPAGQSIMPSVEELLGPAGQIFNAQARINAVVFLLRKETRENALQSLDDFVRDLQAGETHEGSLYDVLDDANQVDAVLEALGGLRDAIMSNQGLRAIRELAEGIKTLLDEAVQKLRQP